MQTKFLILFSILAVCPAWADARQALVIANANYANTTPLTNPVNDAKLVGAALKKVGFAVTVKQNLGKAAMETALHDFSRSAETADVALIYYAGHGLEMQQNNYLIPVDAKLVREQDLNFEAIPLPLVEQSVAGAQRLRLVVLDACRNNPFKMQKKDGTRAINRGLSRVEPDSDTLVVYAAKDGTTAADGVGNSPFAKAFAKEIVVPGQEVRLMLGRIRDDVMAATHKDQEPYIYGSLGGTAYYLASPVGGVAETGPQSSPGQAAPPMPSAQKHMPKGPKVAQSDDQNSGSSSNSSGGGSTAGALGNFLGALLNGMVNKQDSNTDSYEGSSQSSYDRPPPPPGEGPGVPGRPGRDDFGRRDRNDGHDRQRYQRDQPRHESEQPRRSHDEGRHGGSENGHKHKKHDN
jgi:hypothetical protein